MIMEGSRSLGLLDRGNGSVVLVVVLFGLLSTVFVFRPKPPSTFAAGSGYGVGYGSGSIMLTGGSSSPRL
jgi:hypothetical protein